MSWPDLLESYLNKHARWAWWVVRDDGERCSGPFDTREEAESVRRGVYDTSEYRVDYQYVALTVPQDGEV